MGEIKKQLERIGFYGWVRFIAGLIILGGLLTYDVHYERPVEMFLYAFPAYLLGMDALKWIKPK